MRLIVILSGCHSRHRFRVCLLFIFSIWKIHKQCWRAIDECRLAFHFVRFDQTIPSEIFNISTFSKFGKYLTLTFSPFACTCFHLVYRRIVTGTTEAIDWNSEEKTGITSRNSGKSKSLLICQPNVKIPSMSKTNDSLQEATLHSITEAFREN